MFIMINAYVYIGIMLLISCACSKDAECGYAGRELNAKWRKSAEQQINSIRKADLVVTVKGCDGRPAPNAHLHIRMKRHDFAFGCAVGAKQLMGNDKDSEIYRNTVLRLYNKVVLENDLKMGAWEKGKKSLTNTKYNLQQTFTSLNWLKNNKIPVRGHYVSWGRVNHYLDYKQHADQPQVFLEILLAHIREKVPAVGGLVSEWDVLNHPLSKRGIDTLEIIFGPDVYADIIRLTKGLNPNAKLFVNEGALLRMSDIQEKHQDAYEKLIKTLVENKTPIDGIGFMGHFENDKLTPPKELLKILDRFSVFGLPIQITEFDVRFGKKGKSYDFTDKELQLQADYTRDFMTAMFSHPAVVGIIMWGFWEGRHWYPGAALYRMDWSIKPNGQVWKDLVFKKWWTNVEGVTDVNGEYHTRGFLGDYEIEVHHKDQVKFIPITLSKEGQRVDVTVDSTKH
jgi:endo-1,4-beta-xylanase